MPSKLVVIGNGMAGMRCVEEIVKRRPGHFKITVFGAESRPNYNRILLSKVLQGESRFEDIILHSLDWYQEHEVQLHSGEQVVRIDPEQRMIHTASGMQTEYDVLIIATGSVPFIPPIPGSDKKGVISFRSMEDCQIMTEYASQYRRAAVIGGGLLGLEAARGLLHLGMEAHVVHNASYLMNRQLDALSAGMLQQELEQQGMIFHLNRNTLKITGTTRAQGLRFDQGDRLAADLVVMAVGIRPHIRLAEQAGIQTGRAILVDDLMQTSEPGIYAIGECAEHRGISYGLVAPLYEQAQVLAAHLCEQPTAGYQGSIPYSQLKISGVHVFSIGDIQAPEAEDIVQQYDGVRRTYRRVLATRGSISGAILYGETAEGTALVEAVRRGQSAEEWLALNSTDAHVSMNPADAAAIALSPHSVVCACNAVTKCMILDTMTNFQLETADEVREHTRASGSCGGCRPTVEALVRCHAAGITESAPVAAEHAPAAEEIPAICSCTSLSHEGLRLQIHQQGWQTPAEVRQQLNWKTADGCLQCLPAIHYYLNTRRLIQSANLEYFPTDIAEMEIDHRLLENRHHVSGNLAQHTWTNTMPAAAVSSFMSTSLSASLLLHADPALLQQLPDSGDLLQQLYSRWQIIVPAVPLQLAAAVHSDGPAGVLLYDLAVCSSPAGWEIYAGGSSIGSFRRAELIAQMDSFYEAIRLLSLCIHYYYEQSDYGEPVWQWLERTSLPNVREQILNRYYEQHSESGMEGAISYEHDENAVPFLQRTM
ncbi:FAD-dependent oxidoreductase [Paenibacillus dauci]|uniref:FAD-dependent oxidoreductase n=1 Tax=Paenibacillus dauci TaxID=1567106 RepID=UPI0006199995|nr:FAD-dependent oxidoreductase [Paenibacillus dauci]